MTEESALHLASQVMMIALTIGGPLLLVSLVVGLLVSIFQAATQLQEQTLTLIPKIIAIAVLIVVLGPWMLDKLITFTTNLYTSIPTLVG